VLVISGALGVFLQARPLVRFAAHVAGVCVLMAVIGFHARGLVLPEQVECGCLRLLGPMTHGAYLVASSALCAVGVLSLAPLQEGRRRARNEPLPLMLGLVSCVAGWLMAGLTLGAPAPTLPAEWSESGDGVATLRSASALPARAPSEAPAPAEDSAEPATSLDVEVEVPGFEGEMSLQILDASHQATTTETLQVLGGRAKWSDQVRGEFAFVSAEVLGRPPWHRSNGRKGRRFLGAAVLAW